MLANKNELKAVDEKELKNPLFDFHKHLFEVVKNGDDNLLIEALSNMHKNKIRLSQVDIGFNSKPLLKQGYDLLPESDFNFLTEINNSRNKENDSLLSVAIKHEKISAIIILIKYGADVNHKSHFTSPLHEAIATENIEIVKLLIQHGANIENKNIAGETALHSAAELGNCQIAKLLIENKADVNAISAKHLQHTPLRFAICSGNIDLVKLLISAGVDVNKNCDLLNCTSIHIAVSHGKVDIFRLLLKSGADIMKKSVRDGDLWEWMKCVNGPDEKTIIALCKVAFKHMIETQIGSHEMFSSNKKLLIIKKIRKNLFRYGYFEDLLEYAFGGKKRYPLDEERVKKILLECYNEFFDEYYIQEMNATFKTNYSTNTLFFRCLNFIVVNKIEKNTALPKELDEAISFLENCHK